MSFVQETDKKPTKIGKITLVLEDYGPTPPLDLNDVPIPRYQRFVTVEILDQNGALIKTRTVDLGPLLNGTQTNSFKNLQDAIRVKAETQILPPPP